MPPKIVTYNSLCEQIEQLDQPAIVAISGFGGTGKTTLATKLQASFPASNLIKIDDFIINRLQGECLVDGYDWDRFEQVLKDVHAGKDLHYAVYDWGKDALGGSIEEKLRPLAFIEGIWLFQKRFMSYFDLSVWVDVPITEAQRRGKVRDQKDGADADHLRQWDEVWTPKDREFARTMKPRETADLLFQQ